MDGIAEFLNEWLGLLIDIGLILGVFSLWLTWYRNGRRQQQLEQLLTETAMQLEEATMHLSLATNAIEQLKKQPPTIEPSVAANTAKAIKPSGKKESAVSPDRLPPQNSTQATMILRMKREGESAKAIAERLDIPLAQVKLMLKLHAASNSAA